MLTKPRTFKSTVYLAFIREQGCHICGQTAEAHHTETGGIGMRGDDLT